MFELTDTAFVIFMVALFVATLATSIAAWRRASSSEALARGLLAVCGLIGYSLLLLPVDTGGYDRWLLRIVLAFYVIPHLGFNVDVLRNNYHRHD